MYGRARRRSDEEFLPRPARNRSSPTRPEFDSMCAEIGAERDKDSRLSAEERSSQAFIDSVRCRRWGTGDDQCILALEHLGPCRDARGNTTLTLAAEIL